MGDLLDKIQEVTEVEIQEPANDASGQEEIIDTPPPNNEPGTDKADEIASPESAQDSPADTGQEAAAADEGQEGERQWYEEFGYKSPEEAIKGLREMRAMDTRVSQENANLKKEMEGYKATLEQMQAYFKGGDQEREVEDNPELADLDEKIMKTPTMKNVVAFLGEVSEDRRREKIAGEIAAFKSDHADYSEYEKDMAEILTSYGEEGARWLFAGPKGTAGALKQLYDQARINKFSADAVAKAKLAEEQKKKVETENKNAANLLGEHVDSDILNTNGGIVVKQEEESPFDGTLSYFTN